MSVFYIKRPQRRQPKSYWQYLLNNKENEKRLEERARKQRGRKI